MGEKTRELLHRLGLVTVGDVAHTPVRTLQRAVGDHLGRHLHELAWGTTTGRSSPATPAPSRYRASPTSPWGPTRPSAATPTTARWSCASCSGSPTGSPTRMRVAGVAGRTVTITVRFADFTTITRSRTLAEATDVTQEVYRDGGPLLRRARAAAGPDPAGGGAGRGAGAARDASTGSWSSASASTAGPRPTGPSTGSPAGSAPPPSARPACCPEPRPTGRHRARDIRRAPAYHNFIRPAYRMPAVAAYTGHEGRHTSRGEVPVPLSEEELRVLEQMERALVAGGPQARLHPARHQPAPRRPAPRDPRRRLLRGGHRRPDGRRHRPHHRWSASSAS